MLGSTVAKILLLWILVAGVLGERIVPLDTLKWTLHGPNVSTVVSVPGGVYTDLLKAGVLGSGDLLYRDNDVSYRWVALHNWTYSTFLNLSAISEAGPSSHTVLEFDGIDTVSEVFLNSSVIGVTDNMFVKYFFDVPGNMISMGRVLLSVRIVSPVSWSAAQSARQDALYPVPPSCVPPAYNGECHANYIRKMQASFGWDWGPAFPSMGVWKQVRLVRWSTAYITEVLTSFSSTAAFPTSPDEAFRPAWVASVKVFLNVAPREIPVRGNLQIFLNSRACERMNVTLPPASEGLTEVSLDFTVAEVCDGEHVTCKAGEVALWWPAGYGKQPLYTLTVRWQSDEHPHETSIKSVDVGFRTVRLDQSYVNESNKSLGRYYRLLVNNVQVFLRGSNWVPAEVVPERVVDDYIRRLLEDAVAGNQNIIRVWGGGVYEADHFYKTADKLGLMVWQDMMFACSMYPVSAGFLNSVKSEVHTQVSRLAHHPSIVLWASNNENEAALRGNWYDTSGLFKQYKQDYVKLYVETVRAVTKELDPGREFVVSSPSNGVQSEEEGYVALHPYSNIYGDVHFYNYMKNAWDWRIYPPSRMVSEYGYQSWPSFRTMTTVTNASDWMISSGQMDHRQHHPFGNIELKLQIRQHFEFPSSGDTHADYKHYIYLTQLHQAVAMKVQTETYRRRRFSLLKEGEGLTNGALYWQLNDIWAGASWSSIGQWLFHEDFVLSECTHHLTLETLCTINYMSSSHAAEYGGRWKLLHYYAKDFFSPALVSLFLDRSMLRVWMVNDQVAPLQNVTLTVELRSYTGFSPVHQECHMTDVAAQSATEVLSLSLDVVDDLCRHWLYAPSDNCFFTVRAEDNQRRLVAPSNFLLLGEPNNARLEHSNVLVTSVQKVLSKKNTYSILLTTDQVAVFVFLETDVDGVFSENGFIMFQQNKTVLFEARQRTNSDELLGSIEVTTLTHTLDLSTAWRRYWRRWLLRSR
ncbi:Glycoside hydrolase family 2 immunoglobulin-like beta-sandwich [Trinorchestia longiramus]|nr:Glycoside hydrolase family 2 immunoglobulin-like beta-sandwich [Trinorchestia longiramus]